LPVAERIIDERLSAELLPKALGYDPATVAIVENSKRNGAREDGESRDERKQPPDAGID
jgi:hypothetical protein